MSSVRVDAKTMRRRAGQLYEKARNVGEIMEDLGYLSSEVSVEWAGEESDSFLKWYFKEFRPNLVNGQVAIGRLARAMGECADELDGGTPFEDLS